MTPPTTLYVSSVRLAAVPAAVAVSRAFIRHTLTAWRLDDQIDQAELVGSELVTNAVKSTDSTELAPPGTNPATHHVIGVQLRVADAGLYIEVWDRTGGTPVIPAQTLDAEGGRGLFLVQALSKRWDIYRPPAGGKIVWSELPLNPPPPSPPTTPAPPPGAELSRADTALAQRLLDTISSTTARRLLV
jgi:hypothetical protein